MAIQTLEEYLKKKKQKTNNDDIAPVKSTTGVRTLEEYAKERGVDLSYLDTKTKSEDKEDKKQNQDWYEGWFKKGEGNLLERVGGTIVDTTQSLGKGVLGVGEKLYDAGIQASPYVYQSQMAQAYGGFQTAETIEQTQKTVEQMKKEVPELVEKDLYDEGKLVDKYYTKNAEKILGVDAEKNSVIGNKTDSVVESAGQMVTTLPLGGAGLVMQGLMAFGSESENAYKQGATFQEAGASGLITAGAEVGTELLGGGISFGQGTLDDILIDPLLKKVGNRGLRTGLKVGVEAGGEALEEVASGYISAYGQQQTYQEDKKMSELFSVEDAIESAIGGAMLGGVASGSKAVASTVKGTDYVSGLSKNDLKVVEAEVNSRVEAEEKASGKKLSGKEKSAIREEVETALAEGEISLETIEANLGGKTYETYKSIADKESSLESQIKKLQAERKQVGSQNNTVENARRFDELGEQIKALEKSRDNTKNEKAKIKEQLSTEVKELVKSDLAFESYNEKSRKGEKFQADLSQYDSKQQEVVKKAMESGLLNNTNRTRKFVNLIAKISADKGVAFDFTNNEQLREKLKDTSFSLEGVTVNGYVDGDNVTLNINSQKALNKVVGHEITHVLEGTDFYDTLQETIIKYAESKGDYTSRMETIERLYEKQYKDLDDVGKQEKYRAELTADLVGDYLFSDKDFVNKLSAEQPNVFERIYEEIKYFVKTSVGTPEAKEFAKIEKLFKEAYRQKNSADSDTKYHISENFSDEIDKVLNNKMESSNQVKARDFTPEYLVKKGAKNLPMLITQNHVKSVIYTEAEAKQHGLPTGKNINYHGLGKDLLIKAVDNMDSPSEVYKKDDSNFIIVSELTDKQGNTIIVPVRINGKGVYNNVYIDENHITSVYGKKNLQDYLANNGFEKVDIEKGIALNEGVQYSNISNSSKFSLSENPENASGNSEYAVSTDSKGNKISPAVKKRLANTKAVDENGNPKVLYHGTPSGEFTIFDKSKGSVEGDFGSGFYFTDNESDVEVNYEGGGPDFENKVSRRAEQIEAEEDINYDEAEQRAREELYKGSNKFEVYLNIENPAIVGETYLLSPEDFNNEYDDYIADVEQLVADDIENLVWEVEKNVDVYSTDGLADVLFEAYYEGGIGIEELKAKINDLYLEDNEGNLVGNEVTRQIIESLGFDGIIDNTVSSKFRNMGLDEDTTHYIVFKPNQIKSITNENPTDNPDINLSLSDSKDIAPVGNYNVFGSDVALEDIAPIRKDVTTEHIRESTKMVDEFAPLTEEQANERDAQQGDRLYSLNENDMPDEPVMSVEEADSHVGQMLYGSKVEAEDPFEERDIKDVGKRNVKAYMYENPEVKPFFQQEAGIMLTELNETIKGERVVDADVLYHTGGEAGVYGTKRFTSDDIAYLRDSLKISYADIEKGLKAIIEDHGAENNAVSKRIEFVLNDRLGKGYKSFPEGMEIPANNEYLNTLVEKQVTEYSDEAKQRYFESLVETYTEDIAPIRDDIARPNEPVDVANAKQLTMNEAGEIVEEDYQTRTRKEIRKALLEEGNIDLTSALDNAKNIPMALMNNTDTIRLSEMVFGREAGRKINDLIFQKTIDNEAKSVRWQNQERESIKKLGIKARSKESEAVQKFGEGFYIDDKGKKIVYNEDSLVKEFKNAETRAKIINASKVLREKYDNYIELANNTLTSLGFDPIPKRADYFRHFQELNDIFTRYGIPFNPQNVQEHVLPTDINGLTEFWSPQKNYFANAQPRKGLKTTYDAITGIDGYLSGISNLIFHTGDIQRGRAFEEVIRSTYGEEKGFDNFENLTPEEQQERIKKIQDNHLSNYSAWVHEWTNNIAGKKNKVDRAIESVFGRKAFAFLDETRKQVGSNMIGFNVSSALTNAIAPVQAMAKTNKLAVLKGTGDTVKNIFVKDNFAEKNDFLANRMGTEMLSKKPWEKMRDAGFVFMKGMDWFTSNQIVRSKYYELRSKGMSEANAHVEAGKFASRIMGDRTKGAMPQIYNSKLLGLVTQFQLEVNNQLYSTFYDTYHESKESSKDNALITASKMTFTLGQLFAYTHVFGKTFESIAGYNPTFDVIGIIATALGLGDDDEEKTTSERLKEASDKLVDALPYVNILTGGGRIPVASGIPNLIGVATGGKDEYGNEMTLEDELKKLLYLVPPTGGNQFKKTTQGLGMFDDDLPISGSYTDSGNLRYPVEDTFINKVQAGIFGQYANENARTYFDEGRDSLKSKQIQEFAELDIPIREYWDYRDGLKEQDTLEEKFDYIAGLDLPVSKKNIMINNIVDREEAVDLTGYEDFSTYEEFDLYVKNPSKYVVSKVVGNYDTYKALAGDLSDINADKDASGKTISGSRKEKVVNYINNLDIDYGAKLILLKSEYPAIDDYNYEIVDYLNNREDITYEEMKTILEGLDFTVDEDGTIYWD